MGRTDAEVARARRRRGLLALAAAGVVPALPRTAAALPRTPAGHLGWYPWWLGDGWRRVDARGLARVVWFDAPVAADGGVAVADPHRQHHALRAALPPDCRLDVAITLFGTSAFDAMFGDPARTGRLADALLALVRPAGASAAAFDGLQLDVEVFDPAAPAARAGFSGFVRRLRDALGTRAPDATLSAFVTGGPHAPWDRSSAGALDHAAAQLYDAHWADSPSAGPIVTTQPSHPFSVRATLARIDALGVPRARTLLGVPLYGFEWPVRSETWGAPARGAGAMTTWGATPARWMPEDRRVATAGARRHGLDRDAQHSPRYRWRDADGWHQGWYEDAESLAFKLAGLREAGYGGLALFPLGYDGGRLQRALLRGWRPAR